MKVEMRNFVGFTWANTRGPNTIIKYRFYFQSWTGQSAERHMTEERGWVYTLDCTVKHIGGKAFIPGHSHIPLTIQEN
jgi:hypothetical protein